MDTLIVVLAFPVGLLVGGFVTMLVDRVPDKTPLSWRSRCPRCEHPLSVGDSVPVVSWLVRRGRCRHCGVAFTPAYPIVELVTAALFVAVAWRFGAEWIVVPPLILVTSLMALSVIDMHVYRLPDRIVFPAVGLSSVVMVIVAFAIDRPAALGRAAVGAAGYFLLLFVAHLVSPRGMGFGDVKLSLLLGLHLGWVAGSTYLGWTPVIRLVIYSLLISSLLGVVVGLLLAMLRRSTGRDLVADPEAETAGDDTQPQRLLANSFPFGPALAAGAMIAVLFSDTILGV